MIVVREITEWADTTLNHIYFLSDDKSRMYAYVKAGTDDLVVFSKPLGFSASKRKFTPAANTWNWQPERSNKAKTYSVEGSSGTIYTVEETRAGLRCSCSGFKFRGHCKHVKQIEESLCLQK